MRQFISTISLIILSTIALTVAQDAFPDPYDRVTSNAEWIPIERDFSGVTMVLVPAGCFMMGSDARWDERPIHEICFDEPFWIDKYEVTQSQFAQFDGVKTDPNDFTGDPRPVESITWFEAKDFCELRGGRLPSEAEWEYAARGPDNLAFPWGFEWEPDNVVGYRNFAEGTSEVGSIPEGMSWVGAQDMSGNVSEWTSSLYEFYPYDVDDGRENSSSIEPRVHRGGHYANSPPGLYMANREWLEPDSMLGDLGFRCTRDYEAELEDMISATLTNEVPLVIRNVDWYPIEDDFDGVTMVLVPPGCFMMGSEDGDWDEQPVHEVCFDRPFWIDKYEVTNAQYGSIGCDEASSAPDQPRNCVDWLEAHSFCEGRLLRLPTEAEWEYAARGPDNLRYPWGDDWNPENAIHAHNSSESAVVGSIPAGMSWVGAMDMSGNVWEWTSSKNWNYPYDKTDGREVIDSIMGIGRQLRGGSWNNGADLLRAANRGSNDMGIINLDRGFRCATDG